MEHNGHVRRKKHVVELYYFVAHAQRKATRMTNMDKRIQEGSEQRTYRGLERDREPAKHRRQQQGPGARASEK